MTTSLVVENCKCSVKPSKCPVLSILTKGGERGTGFFIAAELNNFRFVANIPKWHIYSELNL